MLTIILFTSTLLVVLYLYFTRNFNYWKERNVVGPKPVVFFGNIMESVIRRKHLLMIYKDIYEAYPEEKVVGIYRMTTPCLFLRDLDVIKHVMIKDFELFTDRGIEFSEEGLGLNIFHADGDRWRALRQRFTPLFTLGKLKNMLYLMSDRGDKFINNVEKICESQPEQHIIPLVRKFTMASITACAFGLDLNDELFEALEKMDSVIFNSNYGFELDMMYPGILKKINGSIFAKSIGPFFDNLTKNVIQQRGGIPSNKKDFMDLILELRQKKSIEAIKKHDDAGVTALELTDSVIAAQTFVFYAAGYETSASTMAYMMYELAKNPEIQDKVVEEINKVLLRHNGVITSDTLHDMTYLIQVFHETLRKYPVADLLNRNVKADYPVPGTNVTLKKGQTVIMSGFGIHHDPKYYPDPEKFDPERFSPENVKNRHPCAFLPFGAGPRNCIGNRFAKWQVQVCIIKFLSKFRLEPSSKTMAEFKYGPKRLFVYPESGIYLNILPRN
ncbi:PREDICTED: cytochrome P450 6B5-like [Papilio xuthus]|uniref:unspecific monooxygenase n=1 Tax=Papilio xuthus TaxID=66420 RepID=A0AAJ7EEI6_PAPXU|nr:PREDICTED: cytochrome P450 6B5-like [Papilio xuthus]